MSVEKYTQCSILSCAQLRSMYNPASCVIPHQLRNDLICALTLLECATFNYCVLSSRKMYELILLKGIEVVWRSAILLFKYYMGLHINNPLSILVIAWCWPCSDWVMQMHLWTKAIVSASGSLHLHHDREPPMQVLLFLFPDKTK